MDTKFGFNLGGGGGGVDPLLGARVSALENKILKVYYYAEITATSGQISPPQGATILLDQWANGEDALVCKIINGKPDFQDSDSFVSSFDIDGNYILSGALPSDPAALIYVFEIKRIDFDSFVDNNFVIQFVETTIQPDWNQSDAAAKDYIKNKPSLVQNHSDLGAIEGGDSNHSYHSDQPINKVNDVEFNTVKSTAINSTELERGIDSKMGTGIPPDERKKFKVAVTYSGGNVIATISLVSPYTSFSYYINNKKFTVTSVELAAYTQTSVASEGVYFFYINQTTTDVATPVMILSKTPWGINDPDVLLWNFKYITTGNAIQWIGHEKHGYGRDLGNHARNHAQGAIYKNGLLASAYNGLTNALLGTNTDNNFGRALVQISSGAFFDEDIQNNIINTDVSIDSTTANPYTDWAGIVNQFLGFTAIATTGTNATTIVFPTSRTLITGQAVLVMAGNTTTVRGTTTVTTGGTGPTFTVTSVTGLASGDAIVIGARIPINYISAVSGDVYTWRELAISNFLGVSGGAAITVANIATAIPQYNDAVNGGFVNSASVRFIPVYLCASNKTSNPVFAILGQGTSTNNTLATALTEAPFQFSNLLGLGYLELQEIVPFYRLTFRYDSGAGQNASRLRLVDATFLNVRAATASGSVLVTNPVITSLPDTNITVTPPAGYTATNQKDFNTEVASNITNIIYNQAFAASPINTDLVGGTTLVADMTFAENITIDNTANRIHAFVGVVGTGSSIVVDIYKNGTSIFSTALSIDASEKTSKTAATPYVLVNNPTTFEAGTDQMTVKITQAGATIKGQNLTVYINYKKS